MPLSLDHIDKLDAILDFSDEDDQELVKQLIATATLPTLDFLSAIIRKRRQKIAATPSQEEADLALKVLGPEPSSIQKRPHKKRQLLVSAVRELRLKRSEDETCLVFDRSLQTVKPTSHDFLTRCLLQDQQLSRQSSELAKLRRLNLVLLKTAVELLSESCISFSAREIDSEAIGKLAKAHGIEDTKPLEEALTKAERYHRIASTINNGLGLLLAAGTRVKTIYETDTFNDLEFDKFINHCAEKGDVQARAAELQPIALRALRTAVQRPDRSLDSFERQLLNTVLLFPTTTAIEEDDNIKDEVPMSPGTGQAGRLDWPAQPSINTMADGSTGGIENEEAWALLNFEGLPASLEFDFSSY